jgi:hypothetical protein
MKKLSFASALLLLSLPLFTAGCGSSGNPVSSAPTNPAVAPQITQQPASQTVPLQGTATLSVAATGTGPLQYQWSENGNALAGANASTFTTSALALPDSGDQFTVTVTNSAGTVISTPAVITIGPRSPNPRDLRFKHVDFPQPTSGIVHTAILGVDGGTTLTISQSETLGTPLEVGSAGICAGTGVGQANCEWAFTLYAPPSGVHGFFSWFGGDVFANLDADLASVASTPNAVIISLDEEPAAALMAYAYQQDQTVAGGFAQKRSTVTAAALQQTAQQLGTNGSVITAASLNASGQLDLISYTWDGAKGETYDVQTAIATLDNVAQQAANLAANGYILTAVGADGPGNFVLVGSKVHGDTLARPFATASDNQPYPNLGPGYIPVGAVFDGKSDVTFLEK